MYAFLAGHFRVEGGGQQLAGTHCDNSSRPGQRRGVRGLPGLRRFHLREDLHALSHPLYPGAADEDCMYGVHTGIGGAEVQAFEIKVGLKGLPLTAKSVPTDGDVQAAERLLGRTGQVGCRIGDIRGQQDHACAGAIDGQALGDVLAKRVCKLEGACQFVDGRGLAAGNDEAVQAVQFLRTADRHGLRARGFRRAQVLAEVALEGKDADFQA